MHWSLGENQSVVNGHTVKIHTILRVLKQNFGNFGDPSVLTFEKLQTIMYLLIVSSACLIIAALFLLRAYIKGPDILVDSRVSAAGKVVIVTGSNTGIGKEKVRELARRGATVYMACRSLERSRKARDDLVDHIKNGGGAIHCLQLDLEDFASIRQFVATFLAKESRLDVLVNNAGVMHTPLQRTKQGFELQLGVNHIGHQLLTQLLLDTLKKSSPSRIVVVSSLAHLRGRINFDDLNSEKSYNPYKAYMQSKLANILFANHLAKRLEGSGVTVNSLHPGAIDTELGRHHAFLEQNPIGVYLIRPFLAFMAKTAYQGALTSIYLALEPSLEKVTGKYFSDCAEARPAARAQNVEDAERLWTITEKWIKQKS